MSEFDLACFNARHLSGLCTLHCDQLKGHAGDHSYTDQLGTLTWPNDTEGAEK